MSGIDWEPFVCVPQGSKADPIRSLETKEGLLDRIHAVAFAEKQAQQGYLWAARQFDVTASIQQAWLRIAEDEKRHMGLLLDRFQALGGRLKERKMSLRLWDSFQSCQTAKAFAFFMATAEERGRLAGEQFFKKLEKKDPVTAALFEKIAYEEKEHIAHAEFFFGFSVSASFV